MQCVAQCGGAHIEQDQISNAERKREFKNAFVQACPGKVWVFRQMKGKANKQLQGAVGAEEFERGLARGAQGEDRGGSSEMPESQEII